MGVVGAILADHDAIIIPTLTTYGLKAGDDHVDTVVSVDGTALNFYFETMLTVLFNVMSRCPVVNVPSGIAPNGVPMGVQIAGPTYDDPVSFRIAAALEAARGWWTTPEWRPDMVKGI